jgi:hypothetical protein
MIITSQSNVTFKIYPLQYVTKEEGLRHFFLYMMTFGMNISMSLKMEFNPTLTGLQNFIFQDLFSDLQVKQTYGIVLSVCECFYLSVWLPNNFDGFSLRFVWVS